ncbi:hypothetical protein CMV_014363 [Castanea mollissima]|uniref:Uncharacterized protein n=1 Tax=Castanea mollissima TaxID=60419 RepID=A0A8J4RBS4_9ROSI|nr:hypothetical protein CMV_014363 [Castanea mollissima]
MESSLAAAATPLPLEGGGGGNTLSEIYQNAKKLQLRTRDALERLERLEYSSGGNLESQTPELSASIKRDLTQIQSLCVEMDRLCRSLPSKSHRDLWKRYPPPNSLLLFSPLSYLGFLFISHANWSKSICHLQKI